MPLNPYHFPPSPTQPRTLRTLALLTLAVLLAHGVVLQGLPQVVASFQQMQSDSLDEPFASPFTTRTVMPPAPETAREVPAALPRGAAATVRPVRPLLKAITALDPVNAAHTAPELIAKTDAAIAADTEPTPPPAADLHAAANYAIPDSVRIKYDIKGEAKGFPYSANGELVWLHDGQTYDARLEISLFLLGSRVQTSRGDLTPQGLEPIRFGDKFRGEEAAHFERSKGKIIFSANTPDAVLLPGAQDQLSVFIQLAAMLGGAPSRYPAGTEMPFQAIGKRSAESWVFKVGDLEKLALPGGEVQGVKLSRAPTGEFDPRVEMWLAPDMGYLPVRIRLTQSNGDFVEQQWRSTHKP
jgi:hypothetical protein